MISSHFISALFALVATALLYISPSNAVTYPYSMSVGGGEYVHDPTLGKRGTDGKYFLMSTASGIWIKTSTNLVNFTNDGVVWPDGSANWTDAYTGSSNGNLWAPDLTWANDKFYLYYSASSYGSSKSAIFLATSSTGEQGSWKNHGLVVKTNSTSNYNAIDPSLIIWDSKWYLSFGSYWSGIKLVELNPSTGKPASKNKIFSLAKRTVNDRSVEASQIYRHGGYFYLFASFDYCCRGANSTYRIVVGRSHNITGTYVDRNGARMMDGGGTEILASHGNVHGPGGQYVFRNGSNDVMVYHWYTSSSYSTLGINTLGWDADGWPYVKQVKTK